jgi:hypothetical protein
MLLLFGQTLNRSQCSIYRGDGRNMPNVGSLTNCFTIRVRTAAPRRIDYEGNLATRNEIDSIITRRRRIALFRNLSDDAVYWVTETL